MLRQFYTFRENTITTKLRAASYSLDHLPPEWHPLIAIPFLDPGSKRTFVVVSAYSPSIDVITAGAFSTWTCVDLVGALVKQGFEAVSSETIRTHLHALGYRVLRPVLSIASPDLDYKPKQLKKYKNQAKNGEILLYFQDEIDLNLQPGILRCWTLQGSQRKVITPGINKKKYGFGAVNYRSGMTIHRIEERKNSAGFCAFIEQFMQSVTCSPDYYGQKIVLVVDNFIIHRSKKTLEFLKQYADQLFALPTYSPWLNVIERLWQHLRRKVTHNHLFESLAKLVQAVNSFLESLNQTPDVTLFIIDATE